MESGSSWGHSRLWHLLKPPAPPNGLAAPEKNCKSHSGVKEAVEQNPGKPHLTSKAPSDPSCSMPTPGWGHQDAPRGQGTDDAIELSILMEMKPAIASADPILLRCEWSTFVPPWQQKFIDALDAFCSTSSNFSTQKSVTWKCKVKDMKNPEWDRAEQHSQDGVCRPKFKGFSPV